MLTRCLAVYSRFVLAQRWLVLVAVALCTGTAFWMIATLHVSTSLADFVYENRRDYEDHLERVRRFGRDEAFLIGYSADDPLGDADLRRLHAAQERIEHNTQIAKVTSLLSAQTVVGTPQALEITSIAALARKEPSQRFQLLQDLGKHALYGGTLVSSSGHDVVTMIELTDDPHRSLEQLAALVQFVRGVFAEEFAGRAIHAAGAPVMEAELMRETESTLGRLLPLSLLAIVVILLLFLPNLSTALTSAAIAVVAATWALAAAGILYGRLDAFMALVPIMTMVVGVENVVHFHTTYDQLRAAGTPTQQAVQDTTCTVGRGCVFTSLTTFLGFISLAVVPSRSLQQLGIMLALGVVLALVLTLTLVPLTLGWQSETRQRKALADGLTTRFIALCTRLSIKRPQSIVAVAVATLVIGAFGSANLRVDVDKSRRLSETNQARQDEEWFEQQLGSTTTVDVFLDAQPDRGVNDLTDAPTVRNLAEFGRKLREIPGVVKVISYVDLLTEVHHALGQSGDLPESSDAIAQYLMVLESGGGEGARGLLDATHTHARFSVLLARGTARSVKVQGDQMLALGDRIFHGGVSVTAGGFAYQQGRFLDRLFQGQKEGVLWSILTVLTVIAVQFRSLRVALYAGLPNLFPMGFLAAWLGFSSSATDPDLLIIPIIAFGMCVNDAIHYLNRYAIEARSHADADATVHATFRLAGRGMVLSSLVLIVGLMPLALSDHLSVRAMGTTFPLLLTVALLGDMIILPALLKVDLLKGITGYRRDSISLEAE